MVWAASCSLFMGDFDQVANFSTPAWSDTEGRTPCFSTRRAMWHDFFRVDSLIVLIAVSFKCHKHHCFKGDTISLMEHRHWALKMSGAYHCFPLVSSSYVFLHPINRILLFVLLLLLLVSFLLLLLLSILSFSLLLLILLLLLLLSLLLLLLLLLLLFIIIIELTHSKTILENTVEIELQPIALDFKNLCQYSSRSK